MHNKMMTSEEFKALVDGAADDLNVEATHLARTVRKVLDRLGYEIITPWEPVDGDIVYGSPLAGSSTWYVRRDGRWWEFAPGTGESRVGRTFSDEFVTRKISNDEFARFVVPS